MFFSTEHMAWSLGPPGRKGGCGSWALVLVTTTLPVEARPDLDYVARSEDPNCWVSGSEELRPLETFGWAGSVLPRPPDKLLASDWDTSLSTSLSPCLPAGKGDSRSDVSEPHDEDSDSSVVNFRPTRGDAGGRRLHTCDWMCSHIRRNRRILPERRMKLMA